MHTTFEEIFQRQANEKGFSGSCMVKSGNEMLFYGAAGYASRPFKIPNEVDTKFDTASITKVFTATAILQLIEKGLLNFDDCITDVIDLAGTKIPNDVRIENLLNHTSGIADDAEEEAGVDYAALFISSPNYALRECRDFLPNFVYKEPNFKAGTNVRYNNCAFILLGLAIEKISGMDYRTYVTQNIFEACQMTNTHFCAMDGINENTAEGYITVYNDAKKQIGFRKNIYSYPPVGTADSGAYTTVGDLDRFIRALKAGLIMSRHYADILLTPHCEFDRPSSWKTVPDAKIRNGYAFEFLEINGETFCIFKEGQNEGVSAMFSYYPEADITISILSNQNCDVWAMHREMQTEVFYKYREPVKETFSNLQRLYTDNK